MSPVCSVYLPAGYAYFAGSFVYAFSLETFVNSPWWLAFSGMAPSVLCLSSVPYGGAIPPTLKLFFMPCMCVLQGIALYVCKPLSKAAAGSPCPRLPKPHHPKPILVLLKHNFSVKQMPAG